MKEKDPVSLASLYGGAVLEAVDHELQNVLANIQDVNTSPVAARAVTLQKRAVSRSCPVARARWESHQ